ncbi:oligogalacturonate lyase family protein [Sphingomonas sp. RP10(2022)]|uniref:Oligogalacturonate lyase family protein n=1 Tax=Sphingomonas liriopis TaxID=2949094 RepID=A0A9X2HUQ5_9SPHN|nr:oligogalacturonate lyase family protein [Sphingomonas liriopis]MCP3734631.1 oligogalacturonate lyase family protein [Sphingomonas liriopis]
MPLATWTMAIAAAATFGMPPASWTDPATGHRIVRIDAMPGNYALYFNYNPFTPQGDLMIYMTPEGIRVADLKTWRTRLVLRTRVDRLLFAGPKSRSAYYTTKDASVDDGGPFQVWRVDLDTGRTRKVADLPGGRIEAINADETLLAGERELEPPPPAIAAQGRRDPTTGAPTYSGTGPDGRPLSFGAAKAQWMAARLAAHVPMELYAVTIGTGTKRTIHRATDWLNHVQFSPTDPALLMFCHEGPWDQVDRIWTVRTDGSALTRVHQRTMAGEIAGHEFWSSDGRTIWYDLQTPARRVGWLASYDVVSGARTRYLVAPDQASFHFTQSPDRRTFAGDGSAAGKWISVFTPRSVATPQPGLITPGVLDTHRLASLARHDYTLEPNEHFTPDGHWIVYRTNLEGAPAIYAVSTDPVQARPATP